MDQSLLDAFPDGLTLVDCKSVTLAASLTSAAVLEHLAFYDCKDITCPAALESAVRAVSTGVGGVTLSDAPEEAAFLQSIGCRVTYVSGKEPQGLPPEIPFVRAVRLEVLGEEKVTGLLADGRELPCEGVFLLRHAIPPVDLLPGLALEGGYVAVDREMRTNIPGVFAAGDCTGLPLQMAKAVGEGLVAGQKAAEHLDAKERE